MYKKIWDNKNKKISNESCLLQEGKNGLISSQLLFKPKKIISVKDSSLKKVFTKKDYYIKGNRIYARKGSKMPFLTKENINCKKVPEIIGGTHVSDKVRAKKILFTEGAGIFLSQVFVTYEKDENFKGTTPKKYGKNFKNTYKKLEAGKPLTILSYGCSTSTGANCSSVLKIEPFQENFLEGFVNKLRKKYKSKIKFVNTSVGGWTSKDGKEHVEEKACKYKPDLMILEFGHNDPYWKISPKQTKENLKFIIDEVRKVNKNCEVILITPQTPNFLSQQYGNHELHRDKIEELMNETEGTGLCDWTRTSSELQNLGKTGLDLYANNINHPSDWLERIFSTLVMETFSK